MIFKLFHCCCCRIWFEHVPIVHMALKWNKFMRRSSPKIERAYRSFHFDMFYSKHLMWNPVFVTLKTWLLPSLARSLSLSRSLSANPTEMLLASQCQCTHFWSQNSIKTKAKQRQNENPRKLQQICTVNILIFILYRCYLAHCLLVLHSVLFNDFCWYRCISIRR